MDDIEMKIINEIDKRKNELLDYLKKLISFPSENEGIPGTGKETELQNYIYKDLMEAGFDRVDKVSCNNSGNRPNVIATLKGIETKNSLMLNAHSDVVPVKKEEAKKWLTSPYKAVVRDGVIYGRGASDCKGGLASVIFSANSG